jgi:hypothetical protein
MFANNQICTPLNLPQLFTRICTPQPHNHPTNKTTTTPKNNKMELQKQIEIVKELLEAADELNGEHQEGWDETIKKGEDLLAHLQR